MPAFNRPREQFRRIHRYVPFTNRTPTAVVTGTVTDGVSQGGVALGGKTIIITLDDETWVASGGTFDAIRQDIIDGLDSAQVEATGWNAEVRDNEVVGAVVRTSDTVVTITLSAAAAYAITANETITVTVPGSAVVGGVAITATPTFSVSAPFLFEYTGAGGAVIGGEATIQVFTPVTPGISTVEVFNPNGVSQGTLTPLRYRISRYENQVGDWECVLPVDEEMDDDDVPLASHIEYGWKISITQENFSPENAPGSGHLLYQGIVEERSFPITQGGTTELQLKGSFRTYAAVRRSVLQNLEYDGSLAALTTTLIGTLLDPYGPVYDANAVNVNIKGSFNDLSRYAAWIKAAQLGRRVIRETWDHDRPELVRYDGAPESGITFRNASALEKDGTTLRYTHDNGASGVALIAGRPNLKWDGANVINRIIPKGVDTIEDPDDPTATISADLTLQYATLASPYSVKAGINPDATFYYYIEDEDSIERYGLTELVLTYSEVKNPNDLLASRQQAANVLYMKAVNELIKRRSEKIVVSLPPLANGSKIWALPGDSATLQYSGEIETESGPAIWMDLDRLMLITQRHEVSHPSGIRQVSYVLTAPEMEFPVPGLPGEIILPPDDGGPDDPTNPDVPGEEPCCEDPDDDENEGPEEEWEETFPEPEASCARYGSFEQNVILAGSAEGSVIWSYKIDGDLDFGSTPIVTFAIPNLGDGTWTVTVRLSIQHNPFLPLRAWTTRIKSGGGTLNSITWDGSGANNSEFTEEGFEITPTVSTSFGDGEFSTVTVTVSPNGFGGAKLAWKGDDYIQLCFTPS